MVHEKVLLITWIIFGTPLIMAENYSVSGSEEFTGFTQADLGDENNDFMPDSEPDSDFSISTVHSSDILNLGEESGESCTDKIGEAEWTQNFGGITIDNFTQKSGPKLPNGFDTAVVTPIEYFELLFKPEVFELIATNTNHYAEYCHDQKQIERNDPNYEDSYWQDTNVAEIWVLFGVAILMGTDRNQFIGNTGIKKTSLHLKQITKASAWEVCEMASDANGILCKSWGEI